MAFWNKNKQPSMTQKEIELQTSNLKLQQELQRATVTNTIMKSFETSMRSNQSFPAEFYETGIKQGKYAGLSSSNNVIARNRSRKAMSISPIAGATVNTISTLSVGVGLH